MRSIVEYLKDSLNIDGFLILNRSDDSVHSKFGEGDLMKAINELKKLRDKDKNIEYWIIATSNGGFYDLEDEGNYLVLKSNEINDTDDYYGINPNFNDYLKPNT